MSDDPITTTDPQNEGLSQEDREQSADFDPVEPADADLTPDELAERRSQREAAAAETDAEPQSLEDRIANGEVEKAKKPGELQEPDGQRAFEIYEQGRKVSFGTLIKRGTDVEHRVKFGGISVKGKGEIVPLEAKDLMLVGRYYVDGINFRPSHDDEGNVTKVTVYHTLKPQGAPVDVKSPQGSIVLGPSNLDRALDDLIADDVSPDWIREQVEAKLTAAETKAS